MLENKKLVTEAPLESIIHLLASTSTHAYPALLDLINYFDKTKKLPNKIPFETINDIFTITLNFADSDEDITNVYSKWVKFLLKFSDNPFTTDVTAKLSDRAKQANTTATKISEMLTETWATNWNIDTTTYSKIVASSDNKLCAEILKALNDTSYTPKLKPTKESLDATTLSALQTLFEKFYYAGDTETALDILDLFPKTWQTLWNAHLCDPTSNEYIESLIFMLAKEKTFKGKDTLIMQLELKMLVNDVEGKLGEEGYIDADVMREVSREMEEEMDCDADPENEDVLLDKFTSKLYEKVVFNKAKAICAAIPKDLSNQDLVSIYIDVKKVMEFCLEHGIEKANTILNTVNKVLFDEIKDVSSGVALVDKMLKNNSHIKMAQHLTELAHIIDSGSIEMEILFDTLIKYISTEKLSPKQFSMYFEVFHDVGHPQFKILGEMLNCFHRNQNTIGTMAKIMTDNLCIFQEHSQSMYIIIEAVFKARFKTNNVQAFVSTLMTAELEDVHAKNILRLTIDYMYKNTDINMRKDLPVQNWNEKTIKKLNGILEQIIYEAMEDEALEAEFEEKKYAIYECRAFIDFLSKKTQQAATANPTKTKTAASVLGEANA